MRRGSHGVVAQAKADTPEPDDNTCSALAHAAEDEATQAMNELQLAIARATTPCEYATAARRAAAALSHLATVVSAAASARQRSSR